MTTAHLSHGGRGKGERGGSVPVMVALVVHTEVIKKQGAKVTTVHLSHTDAKGPVF